MWEWSKRLVKQWLKKRGVDTSAAGGLYEVDMATGWYTPVSETDGGKLWATIATNHCPDCNRIGFFEGPHGGLSVNIRCANPACGARFNITPTIGTAERI